MLDYQVLIKVICYLISEPCRHAASLFNVIILNILRELLAVHKQAI